MNYIKLNIQLFGASNSATKSDLKSSAGNKATITVSFTEKDYTDTDIANNTTTVTVTGTYTQNTGYWSQISSPMLYIDWYDDKRATWTNITSKNVTAVAKGETVTISGSLSVPHKDDGSLIGKARTRWVYTKSSTLVPTSATVTTSDTTMTTVPRKNTISSTSAYIQEYPTIKIDKKAPSSETKVTWSCSGNGVNKSGTVKDKTSATSITDWPIPTSVYSCISSTGKTANITLTAETFVNGKSVGTNTTTLTATVKQDYNIPSVSLSVVDVNSATRDLTGNENVVVLNASTMRCTYSATAKNGATISSATLNDTALTSGSATISGTKDFAKPTTRTFTLNVTDSRGFPKSEPKGLNKVDYFVPTLNATIERNTPTDGKVNINIRGKFYNGSFGKSSNGFVLHYRYAEKGATLPAWINITPTPSGNDFSVDLQLEGFNYQKAYTVQVQMSDSLNTITKNQDISVGRPSPWWDKENLYVDGHYYKRDSKGVMRQNSTLLDAIEIPTTHNINDYVNQPGFYYGSEVGNYSNVPITGNGGFTLQVSKDANGVVRQVFSKLRENANNRNRYSYLTFERYYTTNWTAWNCINGYINCYSDTGDYGWYKVLTLGVTSGYGDTSGLIAIKSSAVGPTNALGILAFTYYDNGTPSITLLTGNIAPSRVVAIKKSDNTVDICVLTSSAYTNLGIEILSLRMHNYVQTTPTFLGIESNLPSGTKIKCRQSDSNHYSSGDTYSISGHCALPGLLTGSAKSIHFTIFTPKDLSDINTISINSYNLDIRHPNGGYIATALTSVSGTIQALKRSPNIIDIAITLNTATSFTNNTPVSVAVNSMTLTFT